MAIEMQISNAHALVLEKARERQVYDGRGENRTVRGRATDEMGRPLSGVSAVVITEGMGLLPDAQVQLPDIEAAGLQPGMVISLDGKISARLSGGDYASIRSTITAERMTLIGDFTEWIQGAASQKPRTEAKAS